jgi:hypothetical protein
MHSELCLEIDASMEAGISMNKMLTPHSQADKVKELRSEYVFVVFRVVLRF